MVHSRVINHEEADSRIELHVYDAMKSGARDIPVRTVDTDVVVILVGLFSNLQDANIWIAFGTSSTLSLDDWSLTMVNTLTSTISLDDWSLTMVNTLTSTLSCYWMIGV